MKPRRLRWGWVSSILAVSMGCASYVGSATDVSRAVLDVEDGWQLIDGIPPVRQRGPRDCGAAALSSVLGYWQPEAGNAVQRDTIDSELRREHALGLVAGDLRDYARRRGLLAYVFEGSFDDLKHELDLGRPVIVGTHKRQSSGQVLGHYEVLVGYNRERQQVLTLDPARGFRRNGIPGFMAEWQAAGQVTLVVFPPELSESHWTPPH